MLLVALPWWLPATLRAETEPPQPAGQSARAQEQTGAPQDRAVEDGSHPAKLDAHGKQNGKSTATGDRWALFPLFGYLPETSWAFGGFAQWYFDSPTKKRPTANDSTQAGHSAAPRRSNIALFLIGSLKGQFLASLEPSVYLDGGRWRLSSSIAGTHFPDTVYEPGPDSRETSLENYTARSLVLSPTAERRLLRALYLGWTIDLSMVKLLEVEQGGMLDQHQLPGSRGGQVLGMGPVVAWDDRDRESSPRSGGRYSLTTRTYPEWFGTDYGYFMLEVHLRHFITLMEGHVLALQYYSQHVGGNPPFQRLARLADDGRMRGFISSRYIDNQVITTQLEYRAHLLWRLGAVAFFGVGEVMPRLSQLATANLRAAGGSGLRLALNQDDGVNLRLDFALNSEAQSNWYLTFGEAF